MKTNLQARKAALRKRLLGTFETMGILPKALLYIMLIAIGFVYIYPLLNMLVTSFESLDDLLDSSVRWLPHALRTDNYVKAFEVMGVTEHFIDTILLTALPALGQMISCSLAGYAFARFRFKGNGALMVCVLLTFIVPFPLLMMPTYSLYGDYQLLGSMWTVLLPALTGQGLRAAVFVLICRAFYQQTPLSLDEAARVDGAGEARIFFTIGVPLGLPAMLTTFLFSFVWYWNETYINSIYVTKITATHNLSTLMMELVRFEDSYSAYLSSQYGSAAAAAATGANTQNEAITMAGTIIVIAIPLLLYFVLQRYFVEAVDRSGITGE